MKNLKRFAFSVKTSNVDSEHCPFEGDVRKLSARGGYEMENIILALWLYSAEPRNNFHSNCFRLH